MLLRIVGVCLGRGSGVHAGRSLPLLRKRHWRSRRVATYLRVIFLGSILVLDFKAIFFLFSEEV